MPKLIAFLRMSQRIVPEGVLKRNHATNRRLDVEQFGVPCLPGHRNLLPVALEFQDAQLSRLPQVAKVAGFLQARHVRAGASSSFT